jgi:glycerophosphoryl diester phosphodiesterase
MSRIFFINIICLLLSTQLIAQSLVKQLPKSKNNLIVIAHRGDHTVAPENSSLSIQNAIKDGADYVELDIRTTKDGQLVLMHDATVDRMTNGKGKVRDLTFDEIRKLKLFNKQILNSDTLQIPTFEEALKICKNKINIYLDFKDANVQQVYAAIKNEGMENQMVVYINAPNQYTDWRKWVPSMPLILSLNKKVKDSAEMVAYLKNIQIDILDGDWTEYTPETVNAALKMGVPVWADMQSLKENEDYWKQGISLGLSGIQTDHPKELVIYVRNVKKTN